jgi:glutamine synthetase
MRHYIAGQVRTIIPMMPIFSPTPAAFKRNAPYGGPSTSENWGRDNKMCALRVLSYDGSGCRIEHRQPGADANIYLVVAAMLAGGLHGIENELEPPPPTTGDAYADPTLRQVPQTIEEALGEFEQDPAANEYLGEEFVRRYAATRRGEADLARKAITDWDLERYLLSA